MMRKSSAISMALTFLPRVIPVLALVAMLGVPSVMAAKAIAWGTEIDARTQSQTSRQLAQTLAKPQSAQWRAKGDQHRTYRFAEANADLPYRLCVPSNWDGKKALPLVMFLHGAGNDESSYLDQNNKLMIKLADEHGVILVSPMGHESAYGTFIRIPAFFDEQAEADKMLAKITTQSNLANELSEKDVINVLELVLNEYPVDSGKVFLTGHSMGSGGTWYLGAKYSFYWRAIAPMSGPFVLSQGYPWDVMLKKPIFVTEGNNTATTESSRKLRDWMVGKQAQVAFKEVAADHAGMVPLVLPNVFHFFDSVSQQAVAVSRPAFAHSRREKRMTHHFPFGILRHSVPDQEPTKAKSFDTQGKSIPFQTHGL
jgi:poly(3-hydroxybutyrate) depolymerase